MQAILNIAIRGVRKAGAYLLRERERLETNVGADKIKTLQGQAETIMKEVIEKAYPDHAIVAASTALPETLPDTVWYVEVVSGFENLLRNIPHYAFVISIEEKGKVKYSLIYNPHTDEIFTAAAGGGAQCNSYKIRMQPNRSMDEAIFASSMLQAGQLKNAQLLADLNNTGAAFYNQGCSALSLASVAAGRIDGFFGKALSKTVLNAGVLLIKESGGLVADFSGGLDILQKGELVASTSVLFKALLKELKE